MKGRLWPDLLPDFIATTSLTAVAPRRLCLADPPMRHGPVLF